MPPVTLAEIAMNQHAGLDFYDVSLVDGYNLPLSIQPSASFQTGDNGKYDCKRAGCNRDLNAICPAELAIKNRDNWTVACQSACSKFNTDQYCCRGAHNKPETCKSQYWPKNYPAIFKEACPDAYSYAYDDTLSTFTCRGKPRADYNVVICP